MWWSLLRSSHARRALEGNPPAPRVLSRWEALGPDPATPAWLARQRIDALQAASGEDRRCRLCSLSASHYVAFERPGAVGAPPYGAHVGANKRYEGVSARRQSNARAELSALVPVSLPGEVVTATGGPVKRADPPVLVRAYIGLGAGRLVQVEGVALAWNRRVVQVQYVGASDEPQQVWLWAGAVERMKVA